MEALTHSEAVLVLFQLGALVFLWGIYNEIRKLVVLKSKEDQ